MFLGPHALDGREKGDKQNADKAHNYRSLSICTVPDGSVINMGGFEWMFTVREMKYCTHSVLGWLH